MPIYKIADRLVKCNPQFNKLKQNIEKYRISDCRDAYDISLNQTQIDVLHREYVGFSDEEIEYFGVGKNFYFHLLDFGGIMLHSSAISFDGKAYMFSADSGVGKSTHTEQWKKLFGDKIQIINDDKPVIIQKNGEMLACGTPFSGKTSLNLNVMIPVGAICFIEQSSTDEIRRLSSFEAIPMIMNQTNNSKFEKRMDKALDTIDKLLANVPIYLLKCTPTVNAAKVAAREMAGVKI